MLDSKRIDKHEALKARIKKLELVRYDLANPIEAKKDFRIDLHGGHSKPDAIKMFRREMKRIEQGLLEGSIIPNSGVEMVHVVNLICGYGHHALDANGNGTLKSSMLEYLTNSKFDFVYIERHGTFLIKIDVSKLKKPHQ